MKTILVDAINGLILEDGTIFEDMHALLETYPNPKIVLSGANDEEFQHYHLERSPYKIFTLKHNPEKTDPKYFEILLDTYDLHAEDVVYFEHNKAAADTAVVYGITTHFYDHTTQDLVTLKKFLDISLLSLK